MASPHGTLADHISSVFGSGHWGNVRDSDRDIRRLLEHYGLEGADDYFKIGMADLPYEDRLSITGAHTIDGRLQSRMELLGFGDAIEKHSDAFFRRTEPTLHETGFGHFTLPRREFVQQTNVDEVAAKLAYISPNFQIEMDGSIRMSGSFRPEEMLRHTAQQLVDAEDVRRGSRLVFDVETSGLTRNEDIWQLSARLMQGGREVDSVTLHLPTERMNRGMYGPGAQTIQDFLGKGVNWSDDIPTDLMKLFNLSDRADYLVAHNAPFDAGFIERLVTTLGGDKPQGFTEGAEALVNKMKSEKMIDTNIIARALLGDIGTALSSEGKELKPYSLENILLRTSFLEDRPELQAEILRGGTHDARVDTRITEELFDALFETASGGRGIREVAPKLSADLITKISDSAAIVPTHTRMSRLGGLTPFEFLVTEQRRFGVKDFSTARATTGQLYETGLFSQWADKVLTREGYIREGMNLIDPGDFKQVQARALDAHLPFAGLSAPERLVSTVLGEMQSRWSGDTSMNYMRELTGDISASGTFRRSQEAKVWTNRNLALPFDVLREAAESGIVELPESARLSAFDFYSNNARKTDVALVADIFDDTNTQAFVGWLEDVVKIPTGTGDNVAEMLRYESLGIKGETLARIKDVADAGNLERYGVQIGIVGGKDEDSVGRLVNVLDELGAKRDGTGTTFRVNLLDALTKPIDFISTTAARLDIPGHEMPVEELGENTRLTSEMLERMAEGKDDSALRFALNRAKSRPDPIKARNVHMMAEKILSRKAPILGTAAAAITGYYMFNRNREQSVYDETFDFGGYENPGFYEDYKQEMGEPVQSGYQRQHIEALHTAGKVGELDRNKIGHHAMGPNKHNHLFGG